MPRVVTLTLGAIIVLVALQGCAALPLAALGGAALQSGAGAVVKTGTEYTTGGTAHRTFIIPENAVRAAIIQAFDRAGVEITEQKRDDDDDVHILGDLHKRTVHAKVTPLSPMLTAVTLVVKRNFFVKDRATTSELLEQIEQVLSENPSFARLLRRPPSENAAASPTLKE
jgi:hypothetical protein